MPISFDKHNLFQLFPKFAPPYIPDNIAIRIPKPIVEYAYTLKPLTIPSIIPATMMTGAKKHPQFRFTLVYSNHVELMSYVMEELYSDVNVVLLADEIISPVSGHRPLFNKPTSFRQIP